MLRVHDSSSAHAPLPVDKAINRSAAADDGRRPAASPCRRLRRRLDLRSCIPWLDRSTGADHRSRAFQVAPLVALSLSLDIDSAAQVLRCVLWHWLLRWVPSEHALLFISHLQARISINRARASYLHLAKRHAARRQQ